MIILGQNLFLDDFGYQGIIDNLPIFVLNHIKFCVIQGNWIWESSLEFSICAIVVEQLVEVFNQAKTLKVFVGTDCIFKILTVLSH